MKILINQGNLTVAIDLGEETFDRSVSCEETLLAAFDIISRIYSDNAVTKAYYCLGPDTMGYRRHDDSVKGKLPDYLKKKEYMFQVFHPSQK